MNANQPKYPIAIMLALAGIAILAGCSSKPEMETELPIEGEGVLVFEVFGMDCPGCHGGVQNLIDTIPGVIGSQASWQDKRVTVKISKDAEVTDEDVRSAIERANFTAGKRLK